MTRTWKLLALIFALLLAAGMLAGCSDDDDPATPVDEVAPIVVNIDPHPDETDVPVDADMMIIFNEAMDTDAVEAAVTLSHGVVQSMGWSEDDKTLTIVHSDWTEGDHVTVTVGADAADAAGNTMEAAYSWSFYVEQSTIELLAIDPPSGTTGLTRNPVIRLLFSDDMDYSSVVDATYATDQLIIKADYSVSVSGAEGDWIQMTFNEVLPPSTTIYVTINTSAETWSGDNLDTPVSFQFTTGTEYDTTPPNLIGMSPENGAVIDPYTPYIEFTFDEAVDIDSFEFLGFNAKFYLMIMEMGEPHTQDGGTVLRLPLPTPLDPGQKLEFMLDSFADIYGNIQQDQDLDYGVAVQGTPDYYPVVDGAKYGMDVRETDGEIGSPIPDSTYEYDEFYRIDTQTDGTFLKKVFYTYDYVQEREWDILEKTSSAILIHGFHEIDYPVPMKVDPIHTEVLFDDPLTWLKLPPRATSWTESTTMIEPDSQMAVDLDVEARILEKIAVLPIEGAKGELPAFFAPKTKASEGIYWVDCWKTVIDHELSYEGETFIAGSDTVWYAPNVGPVLEHSVEYEYEGDGGDWEEITREWFPVGDYVR